MQGPGLVLERLSRRLAECPPDFLADPARLGGPGVVVPAVAADLLCSLGGSPLDEVRAAGIQGAESAPFARNRLGLALAACWLLADPWFREAGGLAARAEALLRSGLDALAGAVRFEECVTAADRREELVRVVLAALGLRPDGETPEQAEDRLRSLDSVETRRVAELSAERTARAREVARRMARKAAAEAAAKVSRE
ncbi:MAG: hypothetical protein HY928_13265 [Elusimicrobia bacterium]|nr:hypothetical protein [Elusimicrobiota bacterium]